MADDLLRKTEAETAAGGRSRVGPRIGFALGAGAARGWAHIGAMHELKAMGLVPDIVVGSSIGALVGGCYAAGRLDELSRSPGRSTGGACSGCSTSPSAAPA